MFECIAVLGNDRASDKFVFVLRVLVDTEGVDP